MSTATAERVLAPFANKELLGLSDGDVKRLCPAAFAVAPRDDVSAKYGFVSTADLIKAMREFGFVPTQVNAYMRRNADIRQFTKHMIRFRKAGDNVKKLVVGDVVPQLCLINSHDRSSMFQLVGGLWRLVCGNGLMVSQGANVEPLVIRHTTAAVEGLLDAAGKLIKQQKYVFELVDEMKGTTLNDKQAITFADEALHIRPERAGTIDPKQLLNPRRPEDAGMDLWHVFNRVQENMMRGGLNGVTGNNRAVVTRGVTSVNADLHLNSNMWRVAVEAIERARASSAKAGRKAPAKAATPAEAPAADTPAA